MDNRLHSALETMEWSPTMLARYLGINGRAMRRAVRGDFPLPEAAMDWLVYVTEPVAGHPPSRKLVAERIAVQPLPDGWGTGDLPLMPRARRPGAAEQAPDGPSR
jgi:hypothetical protein